MNKPFVQLVDISKRFGTIQANKDVCIDVNHGEILALLGENGSGKSTLVNMLSGLYTPDSGSIYINGKKKVFTSPEDAIKNNIGMVHQHFKLVSVMTALENIALGEKNSFLFSRKKVEKKIKEIEDKFSLHINLNKKVYELSVGEKQTLEILKVLYRGAKILILDEPTAVLAPQEIKKLFDVLRNMKEAGCSIVIITHKLNEVLEISDRVSILRKGKSVGTVNTKDTNQYELTELMVGETVDLRIKREKSTTPAEPMLKLRNVSKVDNQGIKVLDNISFDLYGGEILGVAGIAGSGQKELCDAIAGLLKIDSGSICFIDEEISTLSPMEISKKGISMSFIPEDRLGVGLVAGMNIIDNVLLKMYKDFPGYFVNRNIGKKKAEEIVKKYGVVTPSVYHIVKKLSGGNIQKILLGREIESKPRLLITAYPVRGLDIGASYSVYEMLNEQKRRGVAVLFIGEDLDVLRELCDRLMVLHNGKIVEIVDPIVTSKEDIGLMMLGGEDND